VSTLEEGNDDGRIVTIQSLSNAQLIQILQHHDDDELTQMIEEELARRKTDGAPLQ
jgi:Mg/Co/Ni transporter MgtE